MLSNHNDSTMIRHYLLGKLVDAERDSFEERLFSDDELLGELLATEDELIDSSIAGELGQDDAESFASGFLVTPEQQENLLFRQSLRRKANPRPPAPEPVPPPLPWYRQSWLHGAALAAVVLVIIGASFSALRLYQTSSVELTLNHGSAGRGVGQVAQRVKLPHRFSTLKLHLNLPQPTAPARGYRVEMLTADDKTINVTPVSHHEQVVDLTLSASALPPGQYAFHVYAVKPDGAEERIAGSYLLTVD
jgi:hypothetical protein